MQSFVADIGLNGLGRETGFGMPKGDPRRMLEDRMQDGKATKKTRGI
jgi:hypothetical protein